VAPSPTTRDVSALVENMFADVFTAPERVELLEWISRWEAENPDVQSAHRVTAWIDVAYSYQEYRKRNPVAAEERAEERAVEPNAEPETTAIG
jgi:hypothetical protein